jgi:hypothetical protein
MGLRPAGAVQPVSRAAPRGHETSRRCRPPLQLWAAQVAAWRRAATTDRITGDRTRHPKQPAARPTQSRIRKMATDKVHQDYYESSKLAKFPFEPYWPAKSLRICVTGAGGFIASHLAKRLKSEGHYVVACDWKRNEHMPVSTAPPRAAPRGRRGPA